MSLWRPELKSGPKTPVGGNAARVLSKQPRNPWPRPQPHGRPFVVFRQPVYMSVSPLTVTAATCPTNLVACSRSLVGTISCITMYRMDVVSSETQALCRFLDTCVQFVSGFRCPFLMSRDSLSLPPLYAGYYTLAGWKSGAFRHSQGVLVSHVQRISL